VRERPGLGLALATPEGELRLGSRRWCALPEDESVEGLELWLTGPGRRPQRFAFTDPPRDDAAEVVATLQARGLAVELLSGDRRSTVARLASELGITDWRAACSPADKVARLSETGSQQWQPEGGNDADRLQLAATAAATVKLCLCCGKAAGGGRRGMAATSSAAMNKAQRRQASSGWRPPRGGGERLRSGCGGGAAGSCRENFQAPALLVVPCRLVATN